MASFTQAKKYLNSQITTSPLVKSASSKTSGSASHPDTVVSTSAATRSANAAKASTPTVSVSNMLAPRSIDEAKSLAEAQAITGVNKAQAFKNAMAQAALSSVTPNYVKNTNTATPLADAAYNARKAEQDAAAWQQQYDNIYGNPDTPDGGDVYGGDGSTRASSGGSSGGGGASVASLIGNVAIDPTAAVRQRYADILAELNQNNEYVLGKLKGNYDTSVNTINADYDTALNRQNESTENALREAYINMMLNRKNMASDMSRMGYNGGVTESSLARMYNNYGNIRNNLQNTLANAIENLNLKRNAQLGEALNAYNAQLADQATNYFNKRQNYQTALANELARMAY